MTDQERTMSFIAAMQEAERKFGVTVESAYVIRQYGQAVLIEPAPIQFRLIANWTEVSEEEDK